MNTDFFVFANTFTSYTRFHRDNSDASIRNVQGKSVRSGATWLPKSASNFLEPEKCPVVKLDIDRGNSVQFRIRTIILDVRYISFG